MRSECRSLGSALGLTLGSAVLWGLAHLVSGRTRTGLALAALYVALLGGVLTGGTALRSTLATMAVEPRWLTALVLTALAVALLWAAVIVRSYQLLRPDGLQGVWRGIAATMVGLLCAVVILPMLYVSRLAYVSRDVLTTIFAAGSADMAGGRDAWAGRERVNLLLVGADAAKNRPGARTDSMTVASIDIRTGRTVLFGLPRNLQRVPMPPGRAYQTFPYGFVGSGTDVTPGLLNEVYQWAEDHPDIVPGVPARKRGITLLKSTVSGILGLDIDYYAMVDMKGFRQIIDAMGGVVVTIKQDLPYGLEGGVLRAGTRRLDGEKALWYGRSRSDSDDYVRMSRQKCLLNAVARQADPMTVLRGFERIADAAKRYVSTDVPQNLLPALFELSEKVKDTHIRSLQFVPPLISTADPDWYFIQRKVRQVLRADEADSDERGVRHDRTPFPVKPSPTDTSMTVPTNPVSLDLSCA